MKTYNLILVLNQDETKILTLYRVKEPYKGLYNLPGGKIERNESPMSSAYRELQEETGISKQDITLQPFMDFSWHIVATVMHVFIGKLNKELRLKQEIHPLEWHSINNDFSDMNTYAGYGNIGHMIEIYKRRRTSFKL